MYFILFIYRLLDVVSEVLKGKVKIGFILKGIGLIYMDKIGWNGIWVGDIELVDWKEKYCVLVNKYEVMIVFYNVDI